MASAAFFFLAASCPSSSRWPSLNLNLNLSFLFFLLLSFSPPLFPLPLFSPPNLPKIFRSLGQGRGAPPLRAAARLGPRPGRRGLCRGQLQPAAPGQAASGLSERAPRRRRGAHRQARAAPAAGPLHRCLTGRAGRLDQTEIQNQDLPAGLRVLQAPRGVPDATGPLPGAVAGCRARSRTRRSSSRRASRSATACPTTRTSRPPSSPPPPPARRATPGRR